MIRRRCDVAIRFPSVIAVFLALGAGASLAQEPKTPAANASAPVVLFVCEHGSAKSVVAASHFNLLAQERGLPHRAVARGTQPDDTVAPSAARGLLADGLDVRDFKPQRVSAADVEKATRVVALGCDLSGVVRGGEDEKGMKAMKAKVQRWDDIPSVGKDYRMSRDAMVDHIKRLMDELAGKGSRY